MSIQIRKIVVPTDFSPLSDHALEYGVELARQFKAEVHVIHVVEDVRETLKHPDFTSHEHSIQQYFKALEAGASEYLARLAARKDLADVKMERLYLTGSRPAEVITDYARRVHAELIVVGTHGRSGLQHMLLGSVAERITRSSPCPVLVVREVENEFVKTDHMSKLPGVE